MFHLIPCIFKCTAHNDGSVHTHASIDPTSDTDYTLQLTYFSRRYRLSRQASVERFPHVHAIEAFIQSDWRLTQSYHIYLAPQLVYWRRCILAPSSRVYLLPFCSHRSPRLRGKESPACRPRNPNSSFVRIRSLWGRWGQEQL